MVSHLVSTVTASLLRISTFHRIQKRAQQEDALTGPRLHLTSVYHPTPSLTLLPRCLHPDPRPSHSADNRGCGKLASPQASEGGG
ncbi:Hypothetical protein NTJ_05315 [Nesidiocoris tenuis]|uniref:Uncharacterized protein n=1 Tax=Nesidiocoris tenuis TaxID=355587 RepID=A0ABN7ANP4_9HEMI|nr:Hypothetical protein NTJ_05315 [Nesidiocoris tenuis]